ncbi:stalk domain-containing protein [Paenibacillus sp. A3M_27_13]
MIFYNGKSYTFSAAPKVINGITYIPVQSIKGLSATMKSDSSKSTF